MRHPLTLDMLHRLIRATICPKCDARPKGSDSWGASAPRACEPACPLFIHLPGLTRIASFGAERGAPPPAGYEDAIRETVCSACHLNPSAGEYCHAFLARTCPVSVFGAEVIAALTELMARRHEPPAGQTRRPADSHPASHAKSPMEVPS